MPPVITLLFFPMFITIALVPLFTKLALQLHMVDIPEARKVHKKPIPRVGGAAMALAIFVTALSFIHKNDFITALLLGMGIIFMVGLADDAVNLGYKSKFAGQIAAALIVIFFGKVRIVTVGSLIPSSLCLTDWASVILTFFVIIGVTNAINLADGLDGLAGGLCFMVFCCLAYLAYKAQMMTILCFSITIAGAVFGFLRFNTYPASIFMGDSGSQLLGFSGIVLAIKLTQENLQLSPVLPLFLFGLPILDTLTVMSQRIIQGRSPFVADNNHVHHKLMRLGLSHTEAVFSIYGVQSILIIFALFFRSCSDLLLLLAFVLFSASVVTGFTVSELRGHRFKRSYFLDNRIKAKLVRLKKEGLLIKISFAGLKLVLPAVFALSLFIPPSIPKNFTFISAVSLALVAISLIFKIPRAGLAVRLAVYMMGPFIIYLSQMCMLGHAPERYVLAYDFCFLFLAFLGIATLKLTRRKRGFKFTTMDFLILVILLTVLIMPDKQVQNYHLGTLVSKVVILFFTFEVIAGEMRGKWLGISIAVVALCSLTILRGLYFL